MEIFCFYSIAGKTPLRKMTRRRLDIKKKKKPDNPESRFRADLGNVNSLLPWPPITLERPMDMIFHNGPNIGQRVRENRPRRSQL
jgi:hypothetical protein